MAQPQPPSNRDTARIEAESLIASGNALLDAGEYDGAIADYERAVSADRTIALARRNRRKIASAYASRGNAKTHAGDYEGARADYEFAGELAQGLRPVVVALKIAILVYRGVAKAEQGDNDGAIADYNRAITLNPNYARAYSNRGIAESRQGDNDGAIADYNRAIALNPNYATAYSNRGAAKGELGDYDGAIADCDRAIALNPNFAETYYNRGNAKRELADYNGAIADYDRTIALNPNYVNAYNNRGIVRSDHGDYDGAIADYDRAIAFNPNDAVAYNNRSIAKGLQRNYDGAIADLELACASDEDFAPHPDVIYGLRAAKAEIERVAEVERLRSEKEELRSEKEQFVEMADEEIATLRQRNAVLLARDEKWQEQVAELEAKLREQGLAARYMPAASGRLQSSDADAAPDKISVVYYPGDPESSPFIWDWQVKRSKDSQDKIRAAIAQMRKGNFLNSKSVHASGVFERRLRSGERIYYARLSATTIVILHGGDKGDSDQVKDIAIAQERWDDYRQRQAQPAT